MIDSENLSESSLGDKNDQSIEDISTQAQEIELLEQVLLQAVTFHQAGQIDDAERLYRDILQQLPTQPNANHNLGVIALESKDVDASLVLFKTALEAAPDEPQFWISYIDALLQAGQYDYAEQVLAHGIEGGLQGDEVDSLKRKLADKQQAEVLKQAGVKSGKAQHKAAAKTKKNSKEAFAKPSVGEMNALATLFNQGNLAESEKLATAITQRFPKHGFGWKVLGAIRQQQGLNDEAFHALKMAAEFLPNDSEAHYNLGNCFYDQNQLEEAAACYQKAVRIEPGFAKAHYNLGNILKNQECLGRAEASYRKALKIDPNNAQIHCNLAHVLYEQERFSNAMKYYKQALKIQPDFTAAHVGLGATFKAMGQLQEAEVCYREALNINPSYVDAYNNLGVVLKELGQVTEAEECYRAVLTITPESAEAYDNLGTLLKELGQVTEAEECYRAVLTITPESAEAYNNLGLLLKSIGKAAESEPCYIKALDIDPLRESIHNNLGLALAEQGRFPEAEVCYRKALEISPNYLAAHSNLGLALHYMARFPEAESAFEQALEINPDHVLVLSNLSMTLGSQGQLRRAEACLRKSLDIAPEYINSHINLCTNYLAQGRTQEAEATCLRALQIQPDSTIAKSNLLFTMNYSGNHSADFRLEQARQYGRMAAEKVDEVFTSWQHEPQAKRLRVGLVSGDLRQHPVAYFLENLAQHIDSSRMELIAYLTDSREDAVTVRLKPHFSAWRSLVGLNDQAAAQLIHNDGLHVLLDLSGHTAGNRLPVFAWKPASVQVSWLGYFATTGVGVMDYFIADEVGVPELNRAQFVEKIKYLPDTRLCFTAPDAAIDVSPLPALANGYITLGSFQTMVKAGDDVLALWAEVMSAVPNARLRWQCKSFGDPAVADDLRQRLAQLGVHSDRVTLLDSVSREAYFAAHAEVDVILDTFPFPGGTTTCEALWMGAPTLTLAGNTLIARQGASLLCAAGLGDWVVESQADYVSKALLMASDLGKLASLRAGLREQVLASPLFDAPRFAKNMETALWEMWHDSQTIHTKKKPGQAKTKTVAHHITDEKADQSLKLNVEIVSATKFSESDFWSKSALGLSLKRHLKQDARLSVKIAFENSRGLSEIFNDCIDQADEDAILVFIHDDVWIDEANFADAVIAGLEYFDVIGVAGNRRRVSNQPSWAFVDVIDGKFIMDDLSNLSGRVAHGKSAFGEVSNFGAVPAECELMDGVFLATKKGSLKQNNVRFDAQFDFHFYDLDFCRSARKSGLRLGTWLVKLTHQSHGAFGSQHWREKCQLYLKKWEAASANNNLNFPQHEVTERERDLQQAMNEVLQIALEHQNAGQIEQAEYLYLEILNIQPKHAEANHNLGVIEAHFKGALAALPRLEMAVQAKPENEQFWVSYIDALMQSGAADTAVDALELGQKFGLTRETAQILAAEFVIELESKSKHAPENNVKRKSREHQLAHQLLDGLQGLEIGGAAHNSFGLNTRNVDYTADMNTIFKLHELSVCGESMPVDIVAISGDDVPLPDKDVDFVISSHVIEHFFDPIKAIKEWMRLSRKYVFIIAPLPDALPSDRGKPLTTLQELLDRHSGKIKAPEIDSYEHYSIWNCETFSEMCLQFIGDYGFHISHFEVVDTKVGNGFTVVLQHNSIAEREQDLQQAMNEVLQMALEHQNAGQIAQAEYLYLEILNIQPKHAEANHNLGVIEANLKGALVALPRLEIAVQAKPENEQFWMSYVDALMQSGAADSAADALELGQKYGLRSETAQILAAEFVRELEAKMVSHQHLDYAPKSKSFCPVCDKTNVGFNVLPSSHRDNALKYGYAYFGQCEMTALETYSCLSCGASDRERLYAYWIGLQLNMNMLTDKSQVIHFAPEGALSNKLRTLNFNSYHTADLMMDGCDYKVDMMHMPFKDESYDFFICSHVLEHVESDDTAISELYRIMKKGGFGILMAPIVVGLDNTVEDSSVKDEASRWKFYGQNDHVRLYAHDDYVKKVRSNGFHVEELGEGYFGEEVFHSLGLKKTSILYVVSK